MYLKLQITPKQIRFDSLFAEIKGTITCMALIYVLLPTYFQLKHKHAFKHTTVTAFQRGTVTPLWAEDYCRGEMRASTIGKRVLL